MSISAHVVSKYPNSVFVETGTYEGGTVAKALDGEFDSIISVEINPSKFAMCVERFKGNDRVSLFLGDTIEKLPEMLEEVGDRKCTFWLDAHAGNGAEGKFKCPLIQELEIIGSHCRTDHTLLIDDRRLMGSAKWGHVTEQQVLAAVNAVNRDYMISYEDGVVANDIIVAQV